MAISSQRLQASTPLRSAEDRAASRRLRSLTTRSGGRLRSRFGTLMRLAAAAAWLKRSAMNHRTEWKTEDFAEMSWHDVHVHGLRIVQNDSDDGSAELIFDIDYILEWLKGERHFNFVIAQAALQFHNVFGLRLSLDYVKPSAGMGAFSLAGIEREQVTFAAGHTSYKWRMEVNWPSGKIEFESPGFTQRITGPFVTQSSQSLAPAQRNVTGAA